MSLFSGKCDVYDSLVMIGKYTDEQIKNARIYIRTEDGKKHRLNIQTQYDLIPYYPYLICVHAHSEGSDYIELSSSSFVDSEEQKRIHSIVDDIYTITKKLKRQKKQVTEKNIMEELSEWYYKNNTYEEVIHRIVTDGKNAKFDDIHLEFHETYRAYLADEMMDAGYTQFEALSWCFNDWMLLGDAKERYLKIKER